MGGRVPMKRTLKQTGGVLLLLTVGIMAGMYYGQKTSPHPPGKEQVGVIFGPTSHAPGDFYTILAVENISKTTIFIKESLGVEASIDVSPSGGARSREIKPGEKVWVVDSGYEVYAGPNKLLLGCYHCSRQ